MKFTQVSEHLGAEVTDVDLRNLTDEEFVLLNHAWADYGVLFFRNQDLSPADHVRFAERFGPINLNRFFTPVEGHPKVAEVRKEASDTVNIGGAWHTDHSYDQVPAPGSILLARDVPEVGGDTRFSSVAASYADLSDGLRDTLESLRANHSNRHVFGAETKHAQAVGERFANSDGVGDAVHPVVIKHPMTGQKLLYINVAFTLGFEGWTSEESKPLLGFLYLHMSQDKYSVRFKWEPGSIAMWDNRSTWHWALNDYHGQRRLMHRITVGGEELLSASPG